MNQQEYEKALSQNRELRATVKDLRNCVNGMMRERGRNVSAFMKYAKKAKDIIYAALNQDQEGR